jgi:hypothetical protein
MVFKGVDLDLLDNNKGYMIVAAGYIERIAMGKKQKRNNIKFRQEEL